MSLHSKWSRQSCVKAIRYSPEKADAWHLVDGSSVYVHVRVEDSGQWVANTWHVRRTSFSFNARKKSDSRLNLQSTDSMAKARLSCWRGKVNDDERASKCIHLNVKILCKDNIYFLFLLCQTKMAEWIVTKS